MERVKTGLIIDGKKISAEVRAELKNEVVYLIENKGITPGLAVVLVGENPASKVYVRNKTKACEEAGIRSFQHTLPEETTEAELVSLVEKLNNSPEVHGILVQLPLPAQIDDEKILELISPKKDVDGFHPYNMGRLMVGNPLLQPCTPFGIMRLLESTGIDPSGKEAVVIGRSNIVGKPMAMMLLRRNATVTICHSKTKDLAEKVRSADIVVAAIGRANFVKGDWIKEGAVVIDVGMNKLPDGKLTGDVDFEGASLKASHITPVPGGVGPMTIAMLLKNTVEAAKKAAGLI
ncbi:MAG: bifunctional methylenetetrahydrofolate dehydrogenase/methenyltetrahydrofolate cyclohydrolase FolD [Deltaproteobacteria bacterium]|nr:bifunctional methylenetetrahydrofolate dehydrogenase/methenyltetrahydrofolate cyclohydrolase FolD [Deltaproteobacteria bacterium]